MAVTITTLVLVLVSLRNLIPIQYGLDIFIPSSAIDNLRRTICPLFTTSSVLISNTIEDVPLHIQAFRGGYKPDLFLAYNAPITIPTTTLRNLIDMAPSLLPVGYHTPAKHAELQALIARLSSFEGRRIYLLLGPKPSLDCTFCKTTSDFFWYAVPFLLGTYAWRILALGLLTTHPDDSVAVAIRQVGSLFGLSQSQTSQSTGRPYEADRSTWRTPSLAVLFGLLAIELLVMFEFGQVTAGSSRLNHWNSNLHIVRQVVFLALVLSIYLLPAPRRTPSFEQSMLHLDATQQSLQNLLHVSDLTDVTRTVVLEDQELLDLSRRWRHSDGNIGARKANSIIQGVTTQGGDDATHALAQAQQHIRRITHHWWDTTRQLNQDIDRRDRHLDRSSGVSTTTGVATQSSLTHTPAS